MRRISSINRCACKPSVNVGRSLSSRSASASEANGATRGSTPAGSPQRRGPDPTAAVREPERARRVGRVPVLEHEVARLQPVHSLGVHRCRDVRENSGEE